MNTPASHIDADGRLSIPLIPCLLCFATSTGVVGTAGGGNIDFVNTTGGAGDQLDWPPEGYKKWEYDGSADAGFETANRVTQTPATDSTGNPNNGCDPQTLTGCAPPEPPWWKEIGPRYRNAWNVGYYSCLAKSLTGSATAPVITHALHEGATAVVEHTSAPELAAGAYYRVIKGDKRFTAWGASSKVLVPRVAAVIRTAAGALNVAGWAYFDYELFHTVSECVKLLK